MVHEYSPITAQGVVFLGSKNLMAFCYNTLYNSLDLFFPLVLLPVLSILGCPVSSTVNVWLSCFHYCKIWAILIPVLSIFGCPVSSTVNVWLSWFQYCQIWAILIPVLSMSGCPESSAVNTWLSWFKHCQCLAVLSPVLSMFDCPESSIVNVWLSWVKFLLSEVKQCQCLAIPNQYIAWISLSQCYHHLFCNTHHKSPPALIIHPVNNNCNETHPYHSNYSETPIPQQHLL